VVSFAEHARSWRALPSNRHIGFTGATETAPERSVEMGSMCALEYGRVDVDRMAAPFTRNTRDLVTLWHSAGG